MRVVEVRRGGEFESMGIIGGGKGRFVGEVQLPRTMEGT